MTAALSIKNLTKVYHNGQTALKDVSLDVQQGDFFALLGPNGAGKSTTIGIITSLVNKTGGNISVFGHDIDIEFELAKTYIGLVPQEFNFNVFDSVISIVLNQAGYYGVPYRIACERAKKYLEQLGLWGKHNQEVRTLSGGMKRRLMIARALIHEPQLLILDEPTAGVDIEIRRLMWTFLRDINQQGTTIILTTHYLEEAESLCRNIAIIDRGRIVENTDMRSLLKKLDTETFVLYLREPVETLPVLAEFSLRQIDDMTCEVELHHHQSLSDLFSMLAKENIAVARMRNKVNRLEELFMRLVGEGSKHAD